MPIGRQERGNSNPLMWRRNNCTSRLVHSLHAQPSRRHCASQPQRMGYMLFERLLSVCIAQECKKYLLQYAGVLTKQMSSSQYQDMNCYLYHSFYGTKWLWVSRLHDEYTYLAVNTWTPKDYCHSDPKSSQGVPR